MRERWGWDAVARFVTQVFTRTAITKYSMTPAAAACEHLSVNSTNAHIFTQTPVLSIS